MQKNHSLSNISRSHTLSLPKLKSISQLPSNTSKQSILFKDISRSKRSTIIMNIIKPSKDIEVSSEDENVAQIVNRIDSPLVKVAKPELSVITLNKNKKQRHAKRYTKDVFVGEEAVQKFYDRYKNVDKYKAKQHFENEEDVLTEIVQLLYNFGFAPRKLDLVKLKGSHAILDLNTLGLGQGNMGSLIASLIRLMKNFQSVDLSSNQIDRNISEQLVSQLGKVKTINLSHNRIGKVACDKFFQLFQSPLTKIQQLYISDNNLMDNAGAVLIKGLVEYQNLRVLDLSKNYMSSRFSIQMKNYLKLDDSLEELYLGWNQIVDRSAKQIFQGVQEHPFLKVFDYSWNVIDCFSVQSVAQTIRNNRVLLHLDISFCDIDKKNTKILAKALQNNHTIYGIHFEGNSGVIDHKGYLHATQKQFKEYPLPIVKGVIRKIDSIKPNPIKNQYRQFSGQDSCWICETWQEVYFNISTFDPQISECYLHLQNQNYKAIKMEKGQGYFEAYKMFPIGMVYFFFTYIRGPSKKQHFISPNYLKIAYQEQICFKIGDKEFKQMIPELNFVQLDYTEDVISENYQVNVHCSPRSHEVSAKYTQVKKVPKRRKKVTTEKVEVKIQEIDEAGAKNFLQDLQDMDENKDYLLRCIDFDVANSKLSKIIKRSDDMLKFKQMMLKYYRDFKDTFYYLSNQNPSLNGIYFISEIAFNQFLQEQRYITKRVTFAKIILKMYSCLSTVDDENEKIDKANKKQQQNNKLFSRPQFLQFLVRLALQKWCPSNVGIKKKKQQQKQSKKQQKQEEEQQKQKIVLPLPLIQGLQRTMKTLQRYANRVRASTWRKQSYLTIDIYIVIKGYDVFLLELYAKYSDSKRNKLEKPKKLKGLLLLQDFKNLFLDVQIKKTKESAVDCNMPFLDSKRLQVQDGINQFGLAYFQFLECLARYSQIMWFPPVACEKNQLWEYEANRKLVPLFIRFQSIIVNIYKKHTEFHNRKMNRVVQKGLFHMESQFLIERIKQIGTNSKSDLALKMNKLEQQEITLKELIEKVRQKYANMTVQKQQWVEDEQQQVQR